MVNVSAPFLQNMGDKKPTISQHLTSAHV